MSKLLFLPGSTNFVMYEYIKGLVTERRPYNVVLEAGGTGYFITISLNTYPLVTEGKEAKLFIHQVIKEDAHLLFGFYDSEERQLFRHLISVSGIGPTTAILLLSAMPPVDLKRTILSANIVKLKSVKGIGMKTAERLVVELKDKLDKGDLVAEKMSIAHNTKLDEALTGLTVLGFNRKVAEKALESAWNKLVPDQGAGDLVSVEVLIKEALKNL
jgi:Holliday junction DNA helicase RuvA